MEYSIILTGRSGVYCTAFILVERIALCMKCVGSLYGQLGNLKRVDLLRRFRFRGANAAAHGPHQRQDEEVAEEN